MKKNMISNMNKKAIKVWLSIAVLLVVVLVSWLATKPADISDAELPMQSEIVLYYGQECSHCKAIEKFIAENKIDEKITFVRKETWHNAENNQELQERANECLLTPDKVGVPFLYAMGECFVGEVEVREFLKKITNMQ